MKVRNMISSRSGRNVVNQFILTLNHGEMFQSYDTVIVYQPTTSGLNSGDKIQLDKYNWNCSRTIAKYRAAFLGETTKETQAKIDSGEYELVDLN